MSQSHQVEAGETNAVMDRGMDSSLNSSDPFFLFCFGSRAYATGLTVWFCAYLLVLPLFLFVLYAGLRKRQSDADVFTVHMSLMEVATVATSAALCVGFYCGLRSWVSVGLGSILANSNGQLLFHCLTCGERYLAVVHPITYLRLKKRGGVAIRNVSVGSVWVFCVVQVSLTKFILEFYHVTLCLTATVLLLALALISFCSVSILCVLIRPRPGEKGGDRKRINQSKRTAFHAVTAILAALVLRLGHLLLYCALYLTETGVDKCVFGVCTVWSSFPSSLVLPLLFLHRAGNKPHRRV